MIDRLTIQRVKDAASIVDVMTELGYDLKKKGTEYQCLCPFHADRHIGSFSVSPRKNIYHCFSCNAHGGPVDFLMEEQKMTFTEAIQWLGRMYGIEVEGSERYDSLTRRKPHNPPPPLPMLTIPYAYIHRSQRSICSDTLVTWIKSLPWNEEQKLRIPNVITNYLVGTSQDGGGFTIFWQVDEKARVRTGKMMKYKADGHRVKEKGYNSDWIHSRMARKGKYDPDKEEYKTCYFGQHLTDFCPDATICIVESEKTAMLMAIAYGHPEKHLWLACGGKGYLNRENLQPFIDRQRLIMLYPDRDAIKEWKDKAAIVGYDRIAVSTDIVTQYWMPEDGPKADIADIVVRMLKGGRQKPVASPPPDKLGSTLQAMIKTNPILQQFIEQFDLKETTT